MEADFPCGGSLDCRKASVALLIRDEPYWRFGLCASHAIGAGCPGQLLPDDTPVNLALTVKDVRVLLPGLNAAETEYREFGDCSGCRHEVKESSNSQAVCEEHAKSLRDAEQWSQLADTLPSRCTGSAHVAGGGGAGRGAAALGVRINSRSPEGA